MSHPLNRRERFEIGARKGHQRARFYLSYRELKTNQNLLNFGHVNSETMPNLVLATCVAGPEKAPGQREKPS